jgi:hypothetical protein
MNNELKWMWKEAGMARFEVISQNMLAWTMANHKKETLSYDS